MKKVLITVLLVIFALGVSRALAEDCNYYKNQSDRYYDLYYSASYSDTNRSSYYISYKQYYTQYTSCISDFNKYYNQGYNYYIDKDYEQAAANASKALQYVSNSKDAKELLFASVEQIGLGHFYKGNYEKAILSFSQLLESKPTYYNALYNIGASYENLGQYEKAIQYYQKALNGTYDKEQIEEVSNRIAISKAIIEGVKNQKKEVDLQKKSKTNDPYGYKQYYIDALKIYDARNQTGVTKKQVVIAVIDDGINVNHPDLSSNIWVNKMEIPGNKVDDDKNGYIDDYNGWNFVYNSNNIVPLGDHGTMVAGIIGAITNNKEGVVGIVPNVKIMSVGVLGLGVGTEDSIVKGIRYAIDMGANIINLSLGGSQFDFSDKYNGVIKDAYDKGIVVVVAAGNGDILANQENGVDTNINKLSPICNDGENPKMIIGVGSFDANGYRSPWSNFGKCVDVYAYGEGILSTSIPVFNSNYGINYNIQDGTSFSAPIIAGIIGIGFNRYGQVAPDIVYDALQASYTENKAGNYDIDATLYLQNLGVQMNKHSKIQNEYNQELQSAIVWMHDNGLTSFENIIDFNGDGYLTREQASKFFVQFAKTILKKVPDAQMLVDLGDIKNADRTLQPFITESNQLGLFKGINGKFYPFNKLTRAQAIAVLIRAKDGSQDESSNKWYSDYFDIASNYGILDKLGFDFNSLDSTNIKRKEIALMLYRLGNK